MDSKRGVSEVVTAILLILLAVAAVIIVWSVVKPLITETGEKVQASCLTISVEITNIDLTENTTTIKRNYGDGEIDDLLITIYNATEGKPYKVTDVIADFSLEQLEKITIDIPAANQPGGTWIKAEVAPISAKTTCPSSEYIIS